MSRIDYKKLYKSAKDVRLDGSNDGKTVYFHILSDAGEYFEFMAENIKIFQNKLYFDYEVSKNTYVLLNTKDKAERFVKTIVLCLIEDSLNNI